MKESEFKPLIRTLIFALSLLAFVPAAYAQEEGAESQLYDPTFTGSVPDAVKEIQERQRASMADKGFIYPTEVQVDVVHYPYMEDDQFGIQMAIPDMISGCYSLTPLEYEAKFVDPHFLDIKVKRYRRVAPEGSAATQKCSTGNQMSTALMVLNKKDLQSRGTQEIRFSSPAGADTYQLVLDNDHIELIPESMVVFKGANLGGPLKDRILHSFASDKMIALQVPMAHPGEDISEAVGNFARTRALQPSGNTGTGKGADTYYFIDESGRFAKEIGADGYAEVGTITVQRPSDGAEGRTTTPVELTVFVTRPGTRL